MEEFLRDRLATVGDLHVFHNPHKNRQLSIYEYIKTVPVLRQGYDRNYFDKKLLEEIKKRNELHVVFLFLEDKNQVVEIHHDQDEALRTAIKTYEEHYGEIEWSKS